MKKYLTSIISLGLIVILSVFTALGIFEKFDFKFFDILLGAKKAPKEAPEILLVEADNIAIDSIGPWPWKRDVYADMLLRMKELGADTTVFDIEFLSESNFPECDDYFARTIQFFGNTYLTLNIKDLDLSYTNEDIEYAQKRFLKETDGDLTRNQNDNNVTSYETVENTTFGYKKIDWNNPDSRYYFQIGFSPAMNMFISRAKGAGFANTIVDKDGSRRRMELLNNQNETGIPVAQIVLAPLIDRLNPEKIIRTKNKIILKNANINGKKTTIKIPLDQYGRMIINWTHKKSKDAFRHDSIMFFNTLRNTEDNIFEITKQLIEITDGINEYKKDCAVSFTQNAYNLYSAYSEILDFKNFLLSICEGYDENSQAINGGISPEYYEQYFELRKTYFKAVTDYINNGDADKIQELLFELRDKMGEEKYQELAYSLGELFDVLKNEINLYNEIFAEKSALYKNAFCIVGNTASSTTDLGTTPFERAYPNVGTHANVYNTIINQDFVKPVHWLWGVLIISILFLAQQELTKKKRPFIQNICGISIIALSVLIPVIAMRCFAIYLPMFTALLISFTCYLSTTIFRFASAEKQKKFLQTTFGAYVAPAVVDQIVKHPELANLGGKSEYLTALFSDVKTFSGFTEVINNQAGEDKGAEKLVEILNEYLGVLSDAIMDQSGTIDKYVGDEIVSFFGAPIPIENNAFSACVAAIRMLQAEKEFNEKNKDKLPINPKTGEPFWLRSRVGLNTGNMVVGNMGTEKKLNYTIMGNNVNLASRLEGTNKVYGSWIMCSESTWQMANEGSCKGKLVARKFDNVRVINVKKPVGIYNILGLKDEMPKEQIEAAEVFNEAIEIYLKGSDTPEVPKKISELKEAYELFKKADQLYPEDLSSKVFMDRCADFIKEGVPEIWDGVFTMKSK